MGKSKTKPKVQQSSEPDKVGKQGINPEITKTLITTIGTILVAVLTIIVPFYLNKAKENATPTTIAKPVSTKATVPSTVASTCPEGMILIRAGYFFLGTSEPNEFATADDIQDEMPQRRIFLGDYCIDRTEVSNQAYAEFKPIPPVSDYSLPVVEVSWEDANKYCDWKGQRLGVSLWLPTEYQWEKAARGSDQRIFPWGNFWEEVVNAWKPDPILVHVDSLPLGQSPYGVLHMAGNVAEWTQDWYYADWYSTNLIDDDPDPARPTIDSGFKVVRGGSVASPPKDVRVSDRVGVYSPDKRRNSIGFRCATVLP